MKITKILYYENLEPHGMYGTAQRQRRTRCSSRARTRFEPSSLQIESHSTLGLQQ